MANQLVLPNDVGLHTLLRDSQETLELIQHVTDGLFDPLLTTCIAIIDALRAAYAMLNSSL